MYYPQDYNNTLWTMTARGAVWIDRFFSIYHKKWFYRSYRQGYVSMYYAIMDDYGNLVEVA